MSDKKSPKKSAKPGLVVTGKAGESESEAMARAVLTPALLAGCLLYEYNKGTSEAMTAQDLIAEVQRHADDVRGGDLGRLEEMLTSQAHALDAMFYAMVNRSRANSAEGYLPAAEAYMKLALRAQAQCRATAESIATIKNPAPTTFVRQANIAHGPQQVNNGASPARAGEIENAQSKLLEGGSGQRLDARAPGKAGSVDPQLETVGKIDGA